MDVLAEYTRLDRSVRDTERTIQSYEAKLESLQSREKEIYTQVGVSGYDELQANLGNLNKEVSDKLAEWSTRVSKVNEVIRTAEERVGI